MVVTETRNRETMRPFPSKYITDTLLIIQPSGSCHKC